MKVLTDFFSLSGVFLFHKSWINIGSFSLYGTDSSEIKYQHRFMNIPALRDLDLLASQRRRNFRERDGTLLWK